MDPHALDSQTPKTGKGAQTRTTRTRPALCGALLSLLEEKSFEQITIREITERAEVGYATFFRRYPDKVAALHDLAALEIKALMDLALPILYTVDGRASAEVLFVYVWEHRKLWSALLSGGVTVVKDELIRLFHQLAAEKSDGQQSQSWPPQDLRVIFSVASTVEILAWWLKQENAPPPKQMAELLDQWVIVPSLSKPKASKR
jgi:AcrR family transcriptional regulator